MRGLSPVTVSVEAVKRVSNRGLTLKQLREKKETLFKLIRHDLLTCLDHNKKPGTPPWGCHCPGVDEWSAVFRAWCHKRGVM